MNRIILTKIIVLTEFVFHLKNLSAVCTDDTHKNGRLSRGGVAYIYIYYRTPGNSAELCHACVIGPGVSHQQSMDPMSV